MNESEDLEEGGPEIQQDEIVMKRAHVETLVRKIEDFEKFDAGSHCKMHHNEKFPKCSYASSTMRI